jgi:nucleotide-binding universal stress UspA family protein
VSTTILLAVDAQHYVPEATRLTRELCRQTGGRVVLLHVHEVAYGRLGKVQADCPEGEAERLISEILPGFRGPAAAVSAEIRETHVGRVARTILAAADDHDAQFIIVGSSAPADLPHLPLGSVAHKVLRLSRRPVIVVPGHRVTALAAAPAAPAAEAMPAPVAG